MSRFKILSMILLGFALASCSGSSDELLQSSVGSTEAYLIPSKSTSCKAYYTDPYRVQDISSAYFEVQAFSVRNLSTTQGAYISLIRITVEDPVKKTCDFGIDDMKYFNNEWRTHGVVVVGGPAITDSNGAAHTPSTTLTFDCTMKCGSLSFGATTGGFQAATKIDIYGFVRKADGSNTPFQSSSYMTVINILN